MPAATYAPIQGEEGHFIELLISQPDLPPNPLTEQVQILLKERQCLNYTIRNIKLVATGPQEGSAPPGTNQILLYFAQSPEDRLQSPGPFRLAQIPVIFAPPAQRSPAAPILLIEDEEFVRPLITR